jgi:hypothetical protein
MSLLKIPFIIASAFGIQWSLTIPLPRSSEVVPTTARESFLRWILELHALNFVKVWVFYRGCLLYGSVILNNMTDQHMGSIVC